LEGRRVPKETASERKNPARPKGHGSLHEEKKTKKVRKKLNTTTYVLLTNANTRTGALGLYERFRKSPCEVLPGWKKRTPQRLRPRREKGGRPVPPTVDGGGERRENCRGRAGRRASPKGFCGLLPKGCQVKRQDKGTKKRSVRRRARAAFSNRLRRLNSRAGRNETEGKGEGRKTQAKRRSDVVKWAFEKISKSKKKWGRTKRSIAALGKKSHCCPPSKSPNSLKTRRG